MEYTGKASRTYFAASYEGLYFWLARANIIQAGQGVRVGLTIAGI